MRGILAWARPRRWSILNEAVLAVLLAAIGLPVLVSDGDAEPVDVVTAYLRALQDRDVDLAREYIVEPESVADTTWLTAEALSSDWAIASVEQPTRSETTVIAEITSGDQSAEAVFYLEISEEETLITNPYVTMSMTARGPEGDVFALSELELNGFAAEPAVSPDLGRAEFALFPGAYTIGESNELLSDPEPPVLLAAPDDYVMPARPLEAVLAEHLVGDDAAEEQLNADLAAWIDTCVQNAEPAPPGCPFSADTDYGDLTDGDYDYTDPRDVAWEVDAYPRLRFATGTPLYAYPYVVETVEPGWVRLSATAYEPYETEQDQQVEARCAINLDGLQPVLLPGGQFEFDYPEEILADCRPA